MTTIRTLMLLTAAVGAAALSGCGADVPEHPTYEADVHPILVARCIRCHNSTEAGDPESQNGMNATGNFDYPSLDDFSTSDRNLFLLVSPGLIQSADPATVMPLPPAAKLADWQIETIKRFANDNKP